MGGDFSTYSFADLLSHIVDNRGKTCPVEEDGLPLIATNCVKNSTLYPVFDKVRYVNQETYDTWFRGHPKPDDMIFVCKGAPGNVCWTPDPVDFCIAQDMVAIRANRDIVEPKFLFALLRSPLSQARILNMHVGTLIPHFKKGDFKNLHFDIPNDRGDQKVIGNIYYVMCEKIELTRQMNATLEAMAQALFKSWFVDFDPVIDKALAAGNPIPEPLQARAEIRKALGYKRKPLPEDIQQHFPSSFIFSEEIGWIPEGWEEEPVSRFADLNPEGWTPKSHPDEVRYVDLASAKNGRINEITTCLFADAPSRARRVLRKDDSIVGTVRPGNRSFAFIHEDGLTGSTGFAVLRPTVAYYRSFVYLTLTRDAAIEMYSHLADGAAYPAIRPDVIGNQVVMVPDSKLFIGFDAIVYPWLSQIGKMESMNKSLIQLRDTLLPKLLSGELRVPEIMNTIEEISS
jgi:type I restriction enzyme, S subunit